MSAEAWIALAALALTVLGAIAGALKWQFRRNDELLARIGGVREEVQEWARELFAPRADLARVEERLAAMERDILHVRGTTDRILELLNGPRH